MTATQTVNGVFGDDEIVPLSALQHAKFCPRQSYLIHAEAQWLDNGFTISGYLMHSRVDDEETVITATGIRQVHSLLLGSRRYGLTGRADLVEFDDRLHTVSPVEYKVGRPKSDDCDLIQLCAQAFCLEEMLSTTIASGAVYYGKPRRRLKVDFTVELRRRTEELISEVRALLKQPVAPVAVYDRNRCDCCSLRELCLPKLSVMTKPEEYLANLLEDK